MYARADPPEWTAGANPNPNHHPGCSSNHNLDPDSDPDPAFNTDPNPNPEDQDSEPSPCTTVAPSVESNTAIVAADGKAFSVRNDHEGSVSIVVRATGLGLDIYLRLTWP